MNKNKIAVSMIVQGVPRPLRDEFKALCASRGETMRDTIVRLIKVHVENGRPTNASDESFNRVQNGAS